MCKTKYRKFLNFNENNLIKAELLRPQFEKESYIQLNICESYTHKITLYEQQKIKNTFDLKSQQLSIASTENLPQNLELPLD